MEGLHREWGERIREHRRAADLTQEKLAELTGLSQPTISQIESGDKPPSDEQKWLIAGVFRVKVAELFPYPDEVPPFPRRKKVA